MEQLTDGERFIRCATGGRIDRVPYGVGMGWQPWPATLERWKAESGLGELNLKEFFGFDYRDALPAYHAGIFPEFEERTLDENDEFVITRDKRGITLRNRRDLTSMPEFLEHPVKTRADWDRLKAERLDASATGRMTEDWAKYRERIGQTGEAVVVGSYPYGVFGMPRDLMGAEELLMAFYTDSALVQDMMNHVTGLWISLWKKVAAEVQIDRIHIWEDMSGKQGSLISPKMIREFMMPCYDRVAAFAKEAGVRVMSVDSDGNVSEMVPIFIEHGVNLIYPFEVQAGSDITAYRRAYPRLGILGGLDKRAFAADKRAMDKEIDKAREMVKSGRYIPCYDHHIPPDVSWENFVYSAHRLKEVCYGTPPAQQ